MSLGRQLGCWVLMELLSQQTPGTRAAPHPALPGSQVLLHPLSLCPLLGTQQVLHAPSHNPCTGTDTTLLPSPLRLSLRGGFEPIFYYLIYLSSKFPAKWCFGGSDMVCEVWLNSVKFDLPTEGCSVFNTSSSQRSPSKFHFPL